ncbi:transglutaminase-like domain-containing protein [Nocardiopsis sp. LOL_012]|uniref:transglutaminase-like domain-containing protein n=1 Tax=Nocardiopsis sp. LOL_012 TaxID=3345409 RepID=UPI003A858AB7
MAVCERYGVQSPYSDPGRWAHLFDEVGAGVAEVVRVVRGLVVHYRASGLEWSPERLAEVDTRWVERALALDQRRGGGALALARAPRERLVGCCRDFTLLAVSMLRHQGVAARSRVGFASYLREGFWCDHVVVELWDGGRWVVADAQLEPGGYGFDTMDVPVRWGGVGGWFASAAAVWSAHRAGRVDVERFGVDPDLPLRGEWLVADYVLRELAHRRCEELLLWDCWGVMGPGRDLGLVDEVAALLLAADGGCGSAEEELASWYGRDGRLRPQGWVECVSPSGRSERVVL